MSVVHELATSAASRAEGLAHQRIATVVMIAFFALAPLVAYPVFLMKVMCFALFACAFNLLIGYGGLLSFGHAMFLGTAGYASAHAAKAWGFPPSSRFSSARRVPRCSLRHRAARDPPAGHLLRDDHARARADDVFFLFAGAVYGRRGRHPGRAARQALRRARSQQCVAMYSLVFAVFVGGFLLIHRAVHSPFGRC